MKPLILLIALVLCLSTPALPQTCGNSCGDANWDGGADISDAVFLLSYIFNGGLAPSPCGNVDGCGDVDVADLIRMRMFNWEHPTGPFTGCDNTAPCSTLVGGSVRIGYPPYEVYPGGDSIAVPVYVTTVERTLAISLGFSYTSDDFRITSVRDSTQQFPCDIWTTRCYPGEKKVWILATMNFPDLAQAHDQRLCFLNVRILSGHPQQMIVLDSSFVGPGGKWLYIMDLPPYYRPALSQGQYCNTCGDANSDGHYDISDPVFIIAYVFSAGWPPDDCNYIGGKGDANGDGTVDISDAVYLIAYIFQGGPTPHC
ncbi:MAG: hypothetical protein E4G91_08630 [Candidatus Zixiibacteriota bacterium]|nr:MAG: hypothetical protein E4G91_08630 [candidate division Zixibacteria bacterium]